MQSVSAPRWRCVTLDALAWRVWDGEWVVRNERTGNTHLLSSLAGDVLEFLAKHETALTAAELASRLDRRLVTSSVDPLAAIDEVLREFSRLGLAEIETR